MSEFYKRQFQLESLPQVNPVGLQEAVRTTEQSAQTLTQTGQSLYEAGRDMYLMDIESQAREQLRTAFENNQTNPDGFLKQAESIKKGLAKSKAMPSVRLEGDKIYNELFDAYNQKVKNNYQQKVTEDYKFSVYKTLDQRQKDINALMAASINTDGTFNQEAVDKMAKLYGSIESSTYATGPDGQYLFEPQQRLNMQQSALQTAANSALFTAVNQSKDPTALANKFINGDLGFEIDVDGKKQKIALRDYVDKSTAKLVMNEAARRQKEMALQQKEEMDVFESRLNYNLELAATTQDFENINYNIDSMRGNIPEDKYWELKTRVVSKSEKQLERVNSVAVGANFATGIETLNPKLKEDLDALDEYYTSTIAPQELPYPEKNQRIASMVDNTKVIPKTLLGEIQSAAYSTDIQRLEPASDLLNRIRQTNTNVYQDVPDKTRAAINTFSQLRQAGYSPEVIQEKLNKLNEPQNPTLIEARKKAADELLKDFDVVNEVYDAGVGGWLTIEPSVTDNQKAELENAYKEVYKTHYAITGDETVAKKEAATVVAQQFTPTKINGRKEVMRYAPDAYYSIPNVDNDWIREDLLDFAKTKLADSVQSWDSMKDRIILVPNPIFTPQTAAQGQPAYDVMVIGEDGVMRTILDEGKGWMPDINKKRKSLVGK